MSMFNQTKAMALPLVLALGHLLVGCSKGGPADNSAIFADITTHTVSTSVAEGGSVIPPVLSVREGETAELTINTRNGYRIGEVTGCGGSLSGSTYRTAAVTTACEVVVTFDQSPPSIPAIPSLTYTPIKGFSFSWNEAAGATFYRFFEDVDGQSGFSQVGADIEAGVGSLTMEVPLYQRVNARYMLQSCNDSGCRDSNTITAAGAMLGSIGYVKASNPDGGDIYGWVVSVSADGMTLAVGAPEEQSSATGVDGDDQDNSLLGAGAAYVYSRDENGLWAQRAYVKSPETNASDFFGLSLSLSGDGNRLAVGAPGVNKVYLYTRQADASWAYDREVSHANADPEDFFGTPVSLDHDGDTLAVGAAFEEGSDTGVDGDASDNNSLDAGAAYVFTRDATGTWMQAAYIKASNTDILDAFGGVLHLSADGTTLAVATTDEESGAAGINGDGSDNSLAAAGAAYIYSRNSDESWSFQAYIKSPSPVDFEFFGSALSLSETGDTLAVGATGVNQVYLYTRNAAVWSPLATVSASEVGANDQFGFAVSLSYDGQLLAVGALAEDGNALGLSGNASADSAQEAGAAYTFVRAADNSWSQQAYIKAKNTAEDDLFGFDLSLSGDGQTLAVGAIGESSAATGINGDDSDDSQFNAGAVYLY